MLKFNSTYTQKKLLLCDTDRRRWRALHYHYTLDSHSLIKPLKNYAVCFLYEIQFLRAFILHSTQIIHTSHEKWSRKFLRASLFLFKLLYFKSFVANSQYFYCSDTFIDLSFFSAKLFPPYLCIHTEKCHNRLLDYSLTFLSPSTQNRVIWKFIFYLFYFDTSWGRKREKILFQTIANFSSDIWW